MIGHHLKVAVRNLLKYKTQTAISILGLAVGFVCFALSIYWIRYEMMYDHFRKDVDRIYMVRVNDGLAEGKISSLLPYVFGTHLKENFPEVESCAQFSVSTQRTKMNGYHELKFSSADSSWMQMMNIRLVEGNRNFMRPKDSSEIGITEEKAKEWFGTESPIGKEVEIYGEKKKICAIVKAENIHTNFAFSLIGNPELGRTWWYISWNILIKLKPGVDAGELEKKISANIPHELQQISETRKSGIERVYLTPLSELRYAKDFQKESETTITFNYIVYFSIAGVLIIVCALINYLTLFVNRMQVRQREMALRLIHGASNRSLISLLATEFLLLLGGAILLGLTLIEIALPSFMTLTNTEASKIGIYGETILFIFLISSIILLITIGILIFMRRRSLHQSMRHDVGRRAQFLLRKGSIVLQLFVCLSFIGSTVLINRQVEFLRHRDLGVEYQNRACFSLWWRTDMSIWVNKLKSLPMVTEVLPPDYLPMIANGPSAMDQIHKWDGLNEPLEIPLPINLYMGGEDFFRFYGITLLAGEWVGEFSADTEIVINESFARRMGWTPEEAIGKHINPTHIEYTVVGVVKDCHYTAPTSRIPNTGFLGADRYGMMLWNASILFKYKEGTWNECRKILESMARTESPDKELHLDSEEEAYNRFLQSEDMLTRLLSLASLVCILIAVFGIYSLVTLTCEQRRKEIAIRKVNGAAVGTILYLFFREYLAMLCIAALLAFPITYLVIKRWIETYVRQMEMSLLPFAVIFIGLALVVVASISWRVWKAANENPAEVIKNE